MTAPQFSALPTPRSSPILLQASDEGTRAWRKRAPADLQLELSAQTHKKPRITQASRDELKIEDVDELIPHLNNMGNDALYTPQTGRYDTAFMPFVFDDGELSFYTPPGSDPNYDPGLPTSAVSQTFFRESSDEICSETRQDSIDLQELSIWRGGDEPGPSHIYTQMIDRYPARETTSLRKLDPSLVQYGPVHEAMAQFSCQFAHIDVPLVIPSPTDDLEESPNYSLITISSPRRNHMRLVTTLYHHGSCVSSHEVQMEESGHLNAATTLYSAPLPRELIDGVCKGLDREKSLPPNGPSSPRDYSDYVAIMQFVQEPATSDEETVLVVAGNFHALQDSMPAKAKISDLKVEEDCSRELYLPQAFLPTPPLSHENFTNVATPSRLKRRPHIVGRPIPKLSVAIPQTSMQGITGIQLYTDSPVSAMRPTPRTGIPSNVYPVTPFEQLLRTPSHPPELSRSTARSLHAPTPSESAYPFTLASTSPGPAPSPAFGVLEPGSALGSAPAWLTLSRNVTPFTPSFFMPHTAAASNAMSSLTQRAIDAGTSVSSSKDEYIDPPPLASPHPIVSPSQFLSPHDK